MKKITCLFLVGALLGASAFAQELKPTNPEASDFLPLLKLAGYEAFTFDISSLADETYYFTPEVREYVNGELVSPASNRGMSLAIENRTMLSVFTEEQQKAITDAYDPEKGIYKLHTKMSVGVIPLSDSVKQLALFFDGMMRYAKRIYLKEATAPGYEGRYLYSVKPVKVEELRLGTFIPLALVGASWFDERVGAYRFCVEKVFPADLQSESLKYVPHFFVMGVVVTK